MGKIRKNAFSEDELQTLQLISQGYEYKEIAKKMYISVDTVKLRIRVIRKKLKAGNRTNAVYIATKSKIID